MRSPVFRTLLLGFIVALSGQAATLTEYDLTGKVGTEASNSPTFIATNLGGQDMLRGSGLTPSAASNGFSATGWDDVSPNDFFRFGFTVQPGFSVTLTELRLAARSSASGPGFMNVLITIDGGPETLLTTLALPSALFLDSALNINNLVIGSSATVFLRPANTTAANGGTVGSAGTFRVANYSPDGGTSFQPISLLGTINAVSTGIPEPSTTALILGGLTLVGLAACGRKFRSSR